MSKDSEPKKPIPEFVNSKETTIYYRKSKMDNQYYQAMIAYCMAAFPLARFQEGNEAYMPEGDDIMAVHIKCDTPGDFHFTECDFAEVPKPEEGVVYIELDEWPK